METHVPHETGSPLEMRFAAALAIFAALLAINELGAGKYGDDELKLTSEKSGAYLWYQAKGIKESLAEHQRDMLRMLQSSGAKIPGMDKQVVSLEQDLARYKIEKKEILLGSKAVGEANWAQEVDGQKGKVIGAKEYEADILRLSDAGDRFDLGTLFLQLCLVLGAIGLVVRKLSTKKMFGGAMLVLGTVGFVCSVLGYVKAWGP